MGRKTTAEEDYSPLSAADCDARTTASVLFSGGELASTIRTAAGSLRNSGVGSGCSVLIKLAHGCQSGTWLHTALIAAISGIARNSPGGPQTRSQNKHASSTVVAFSCIGRPITAGTIS